MALFDLTKYRHYLGDLPGLLLQGQREKPENPLESPVVFDMALNGEFLQYPPILEVVTKKNVVVTKINGNNTLNVIEHVGGLSYEIKIQGFMENTKTHRVEPTSNLTNTATQVLNDLQSFSPTIRKKVGNGLHLKDNQLPLDLLEWLVQLFKRNKSLEVGHQILNKAFSVYRLVLTELTDIVFYPTAFAYSLTAIADEPIELLLN